MALLRLEHKKDRLLTKRAFYLRLLRSLLLAGSIILASLGLGVLGYHIFGHLRWIDSLVNASMILAGMGPVDPIDSNEGKVFASMYALFSGIVFLSSVAIMITPVFHRFLHRFHLEVEDSRKS